MKKMRSLTLAAIATAAALSLTACGDSSFETGVGNILGSTLPNNITGLTITARGAGVGSVQWCKFYVRGSSDPYSVMAAPQPKRPVEFDAIEQDGAWTVRNANFDERTMDATEFRTRTQACLDGLEAQRKLDSIAGTSEDKAQTEREQSWAAAARK